jgi:hypothetical protein
MDAISGWAGKMFMKQKMGSITDSLPKIGKEESDKAKTSSAPTSKQMRESIKSSRAERDADMATNKKSNGLKMSDRWAANKEANR